MFERVCLLVQPRVQLSGVHAQHGLSGCRQVLDGVWEIQNPHRVWPKHVHQALLPFGAILHGAHHLGRLGAASMGLDVRLAGEGLSVRQT